MRKRYMWAQSHQLHLLWLQNVIHTEPLVPAGEMLVSFNDSAEGLKDHF